MSDGARIHDELLSEVSRKNIVLQVTLYLLESSDLEAAVRQDENSGARQSMENGPAARISEEQHAEAPHRVQSDESRESEERERPSRADSNANSMPRDTLADPDGDHQGETAAPGRGGNTEPSRGGHAAPSREGHAAPSREGHAAPSRGDTTEPSRGGNGEPSRGDDAQQQEASGDEASPEQNQGEAGEPRNLHENTSNASNAQLNADTAEHVKASPAKKKIITDGRHDDVKREAVDALKVV